MTAAPTRAHYVVLVFTVLLAAVAYLDRVCISTAASHIKGDLRLDDAQMGCVYSAFTLAYALCEVPSGWLSDTLQRRWGARIGRRVPGLVGLPLAACAVVGAINTATPVLAAVLFGCAACLAALGVAAGWALCLDIGGRHVGVVSGGMNMFGNLGGAVSPVVIGLCLKQWDSWNAPLYTVAVFYLVAAACWLGIDPHRPINSEAADQRT